MPDMFQRDKGVWRSGRVLVDLSNGCRTNVKEKIPFCLQCSGWELFPLLMEVKKKCGVFFFGETSVASKWNTFVVSPSRLEQAENLGVQPVLRQRVHLLLPGQGQVGHPHKVVLPGTHPSLEREREREIGREKVCTSIDMRKKKSISNLFEYLPSRKNKLQARIPTTSLQKKKTLTTY